MRLAGSEAGAPLGGERMLRSATGGQRPMNTHDVAVVGRGAIGSAAALGFARAGWRVALVAPAPASATVQGSRRQPAMCPRPRPSAAPSDDWDQRVYALSSASRRLLMDLGVWQSMDHARIAPIHDMRIFNLAGNSRRPPPEVHLDAYQRPCRGARLDRREPASCRGRWIGRSARHCSLRGCSASMPRWNR